MNIGWFRSFFSLLFATVSSVRCYVVSVNSDCDLLQLEQIKKNGMRMLRVTYVTNTEEKEDKKKTEKIV